MSLRRELEPRVAPEAEARRRRVGGRKAGAPDGPGLPGPQRSKTQGDERV